MITRDGLFGCSEFLALDREEIHLRFTCLSVVNDYVGPNCLFLVIDPYLLVIDALAVELNIGKHSFLFREQWNDFIREVVGELMIHAYLVKLTRIGLVSLLYRAIEQFSVLLYNL